ncbi:MAG: pyruvate dehydrogenase complex dihydrolipoamide acetyltransferase [Bacteroidota bacterium]
MAEVIKMPLLSDTMTEGVIAAWHKQVGDEVENSELLAEIETDKATMDFESPFDGVLLHIGVKEGDGIPVGSLLAIIGEKDEDISGILAAESGGGAPATEAAVAPAPEPEVVAAPASNGSSAAQAVTVAPAAPVTSRGGRIKASPLAKAMAKAQGIDIAHVQGTGENGRIVKRDIENFQPAAQPAVAAPVEVPVAPTQDPAPVTVAAPTGANYEETGVSQMRKAIARRLAESKFSAPHFYLTMEIDMERAIAARKQLNEVSPVKISFNDLVIKASAIALRQHPAVNSSWLGDKIRTNHDINVGVAVAVDEGLLVPVVHHADNKGLSTISQEVREMAGKARDKKLQPSEWEGNTFTVSNLGMFGIEEFTAIINPPDACIMAVGAIVQKPVVKDGEIVVGNRMKVTLSCDHRVVDGAVGSAFLKTFKELMEEPMKLML